MFIFVYCGLRFCCAYYSFLFGARWGAVPCSKLKKSKNGGFLGFFRVFLCVRCVFFVLGGLLKWIINIFAIVLCF